MLEELFETLLRLLPLEVDCGPSQFCLLWIRAPSGVQVLCMDLGLKVFISLGSA